MDMFSTREIATAVWLFLALGIGLLKADIRRALAGVCRAFLQVKILSWLFLMALYTAGVVAILYVAALWSLALLKDTLIWFCFAAFATASTAVTSREDTHPLRDALVDSVKLVVVVESLVGTYTFSLAAELIILPFVTAIAMMDAVSRTESKYLPVTRLMSGLQIIVGAGILATAVIKAVSDYQNLLSFDAIRSFLLAPCLSISFSPFVYFMVLCTSYELLFVVLRAGVPKDRDVVRYAKKRLFSHLKLSAARVRAFHRSKGIRLVQVGSRADIDDLVGSD